MSLFFEYGNWIGVRNAAGLKQLLISTWANQLNYEPHDSERTADYQPFLKFDGDKVRAKNYIGFIQHDDELIEIYPKVFSHLPEAERCLMLRHIFYWFSYCRKWRFPFSHANLDRRDIDRFPELIIYLMASQFYETVSTHPLMQYHPVSETLSTPKGSLNFSRYVVRGLATGNHHLLECDHEPFLFDNKVNRIIKYCSRLLLQHTKYAESQRMLQDVLFVLDEVDDTPVSIYETRSIQLNAFYGDYAMVLEMCRSILQQQLYSHSQYENSQWCLLFPMEYIFEDFIAGFLQQHLSKEWKVEYQKSDQYLSNVPEAFNLQHDIFLTKGNRKIIIDTKYKVRDRKFKEDIKKGVAQPDLYQVFSYAMKRGCTEVMLLYPNIGESCLPSDEFVIVPGFESNPSVKVIVAEIPFWSFTDFDLLSHKLQAKLDLLIA